MTRRKTMTINIAWEEDPQTKELKVTDMDYCVGVDRGEFICIEPLTTHEAIQLLVDEIREEGGEY